MYNRDVQETISKVRPGLSGIGSTVFRDEESIIALSQKTSIKCYKEDISPYKGELESWFVENKSFIMYLSLILITSWVVICPNSNIVWKIFQKIPPPPKALSKFLKYD